MRQSPRLIGLALAIALAGCAAPTPASTPTLTSTATAAPTSTPAPTATASPAPTATPDVPFSQTGPWLLFLAQPPGEDRPTLWAANEDGSALHQVVPWNVYQYAVRPVRNAAGQVEVAYVTSPDGEGHGEITLGMITFPGEVTRVVTALTAAREANLDISAGSLFAVHPIWSPDGKWLAFGGAQDGPSIDVYSYEAATGQVRRLTSGSGHANNLTWTPDSALIVHTSSDCLACEGDSSHGLWAARPDGSGVIEMESPESQLGAGILEQFAPGVFLAGRSGNGAHIDLRLVGTTMRTKPLTEISGGYFWTAVASPSAGVALVHSSAIGSGNTVDGWYLVRQDGTVQLVSTAGDGRCVWYQGGTSFLVRPDKGEPFAVSAEGDISTFPAVLEFPAPSTDLTAQISTSDAQPGLWLRRAAGPSQQVYWQPFGFLSWSPDSQSLIGSNSDGLLLAHAPAYVPRTITGDMNPYTMAGGYDNPWSAIWTP